MLLSFKSWSKSLRSRSYTRRGASRSNNVVRTETLERRDLLSALPSDGPAGTWQGAADSPFVRWNPDLQFSSPSSLAVADFNNDGHLDLAVGTDDPTGGNLWELNGRGDGTFASSQRTGEPGLATSIAAADFDRDGRVDIVEANSTRNVVSVFRQTTDGGFAGPFSSNVGEFNHARALLAASLPGGGPSALLIVHDINMGGGLDRVSMTGVGNLDPGGIHFGGHWFFNAGIGHGPAAMAVGDFDLDGRQEVAVANAGDNSVALAYSNGSVMGVSQTIGVGRTPLGIVSGDFNGDGQPDLATANFGDGSISILLDHNGSLVRQPDISGIVARAIATADFNGDGRLDLATVGWTSELVAVDLGDEILYSHRMTDAVWLNYGNGDGTFAEPIVVELGTSEIEDGEQSGYVGPSALAVVDLNEDGRPDLAVANPGRGIVSILVNQPPVVLINTPPIADDQSLVIDENTSVTITLTGRDPEGHPVELASFESAEHGTLDTTDDPLTWIYTPNANFVGDDHFTFSVSDGTLESATATISIQVNPVTPSPTPIGVDDDQLDGGEQVVQTRAYVANLRSDFVSVIDTTTNVVVQQIPVGFGQFGIDVSPDGTRAYATLMDSSDLVSDPWGRVGSVAVIDTVAGSVLTTIHNVAPYLADVTVSPRGDIVLLTDHFNNVVRVLSTANNSIVASIPVGSAPDQVAFSPDGRLAYVSNILSWTVSVIDTATLTVVTTIGGVGAGANTVCVSPDGSRVYVGSHWNGVSVIDTSSNTVIANLPLNSPNGPVVAMALTPDGTKLYVTDRHHSSQTPNNVWVVDTATNSVEARIAVDAGFDGGLVVSPDGAVVYASAATNNTVLAIDTATNQIITAISVGQVPHSIATGTVPNHPPVGIDDQVPELGSEFRINTTTDGGPVDFFHGGLYPVPGSQFAVKLASDDDGNFVAVWQGPNRDGHGTFDVYLQRFDAGGRPVGSEVPVNSDWNGQQTNPDVAVALDGRIVVVYEHTDNDQTDAQFNSLTGIYAQLLNPDGTPIGDPIQVASTPARRWAPGIGVAHDGSFVVTWTNQSSDGLIAGMYARRFDSSGTALGNEFQVNTTPLNSQVLQVSNTMAMNDAGQFVVAWTNFGPDGSDQGVFGQRFNAFGERAGGEFRVNTTTFDSQLSPTIAMDDLGRFMAAWTSRLQDDGTGWGVYAQLFDADGTPAGSEFLVTNTTEGSQGVRDIAVDGNGQYIITWDSNPSNDGIARDVYIRRFAADGTPLGDEVRANETTASTQWLPVVVFGKAGRYFVAWASLDQDGAGNGVYGRVAGVNDNDPVFSSNAAPIISMSGLGLDGIATDEDVPTNEILLEVGDADTPADDLIVTVQSSNPELISEEGILLSGSGATRTLVLTPAANQYGFATIVVSVSDGEQTTESTFELTVRPVNDVPTTTELPELTIEEDTAFDGFEFGVGDVETAAEDLVVTATSLAPWLIATEDIVVSGSGADRHISFTPMPNAFGEGDVLVDVSDGTDSEQVVIHITVLPVNDLPTISVIDDQITDEDVATSPISFTIGDLETDADNLSITVVSSDPSLIPEDSIIIEGSGEGRSLILTLAANQYGSATITVLINDGETTVTREFLVTVNPVNDAPTLSPIANQTIEMEITSPSISLAIGDVDNDVESLTLQAHSSNPKLVPNASIHFGGHGEQRNLTVTPAANQYGSATIIVTLSDGQTEVSQTFTLTVLHSHLKLTLTGSQSLQLSAGVDGRVIALINGVANSTAKTFLASDLRMLTVTGGTGANRIDLSAVQPAKFVNLSRVNVDGGAGNDTLIGSGLNDSLVGGAGNDSLLGGGGNDLLDGQAGLDTLTGGVGNDTLDGGIGVDLLVESTDVNVVLTSSQMIGLGTDAVRNLESAKLTGGTSANRFDAAGFTGTVTLIGNAGNDTLIGGSANDLLQGGDGADSIQGNAGNDIIDGGTGHDTLLGGDGNDTLTGGAGDDALAGGLGNDKLTGDLGNDTLLGAAGNDLLQGGLGNDVLIGGTGNDTLAGQGGADTLAGAGYGRVRDTGDRLTTDSHDRIDESFAITFAWADLV